jgi:hypothetical protein
MGEARLSFFSQPCLGLFGGLAFLEDRFDQDGNGNDRPERVGAIKLRGLDGDSRHRGLNLGALVSNRFKNP